MASVRGPGFEDRYPVTSMTTSVAAGPMLTVKSRLPPDCGSRESNRGRRESVAGHLGGTRRPGLGTPARSSRSTASGSSGSSTWAATGSPSCGCRTCLAASPRSRSSLRLDRRSPLQARRGRRGALKGPRQKSSSRRCWASSSSRALTVLVAGLQQAGRSPGPTCPRLWGRRHRARLRASASRPRALPSSGRRRAAADRAPGRS
jgi:hypothetical protein